MQMLPIRFCKKTPKHKKLAFQRHYFSGRIRPCRKGCHNTSGSLPHAGASSRIRGAQANLSHNAFPPGTQEWSSPDRWPSKNTPPFPNLVPAIYQRCQCMGPPNVLGLPTSISARPYGQQPGMGNSYGICKNRNCLQLLYRSQNLELGKPLQSQSS